MSFAVRVILILILIFLIELYFYKKLKKSMFVLFPALNKRKFKVIAGVVFTYINIYPVLLFASWLYYTFGRGGRPDMPDAAWFDILILFPFWIAAFIMINSILYIIIVDILRLFILPLYKKYRKQIDLYEGRILFLIIIFFIIYVPARTYYDYKFVSIRPVEFVKNNLSPALHNFRLVFISDTQADKYTNRDRLQNYISKVNELNPDLVLIGGDIITGTPDYINLGAEYLGKIKAKYGVYSCEGDHDHWAYRDDTERSIREVTQALSKYGVKMIDNDRQIINVNGAKIQITFVTSTYVERVSSRVLNSLTSHTKDFDLNILLVHQPANDIINAAVQNNYDLLLAGHTHGGQVTFLFPFVYLSPTLLETKYVRGTFHIKNMTMIVTRGLGMSLVPLRYNSTPEITFIHFK